MATDVAASIKPLRADIDPKESVYYLHTDDLPDGTMFIVRVEKTSAHRWLDEVDAEHGLLSEPRTMWMSHTLPVLSQKDLSKMKRVK